MQAMSNVEEVFLGDSGGEVTLDISTLVSYGCQGKCKSVTFWHDKADKYREVRRWALGISWAVRTDGRDDGYRTVIEGK